MNETRTLPQAARSHLWYLVLPALLVAVVWPLQTLVAALLVGAAVMAAGVYALFLERHPVPPVRRRTRDSVMGAALVGAVALGIVSAIVFPVPTAITAFGLIVVAAAAWAVFEHGMRRTFGAPGGMFPAADEDLDTLEPSFADATSEPGFWAAPPPPAPVGQVGVPPAPAIARRRRPAPRHGRRPAPTAARRRAARTRV